MTAKEKAKNLYIKYKDVLGFINTTNEIKKCALIAVEEIIDELVDIDDGQTTMPYKYWQNVKIEIKLL